ncbi:hypothetical protein Hypma_003460 [Hypsizygus marmoreus]|uniref:Uncharacterized protein n=1 Tax=Hypsizygus marmoreus TaxID=39966 RepID=A0A369J1Z7_HYPMA|nr:hypothetical protein Hypma_003460 [Hypsizygus marmoreus]
MSTSDLSCAARSPPTSCIEPEPDVVLTSISSSGGSIAWWMVNQMNYPLLGSLAIFLPAEHNLHPRVTPMNTCGRRVSRRARHGLSIHGL